MKTIHYKLYNKKVVELEVSDEFAEQYRLLEIEEKRDYEREKKRKKHRVSYENLAENHFEVEDKNAIDPLNYLIEQEEAAQKERDLTNMVEFLTDKQREVFVMYFKQHLSKQGIARKLGIDESTVRKRLNACIKKIQKYFE